MGSSAETSPELEKTKASGINFKTTVFWFFFCALAILTIAALSPRAIGHPPGNPVCSRGKDIYVAITGANTEREPLGLGPVWPKTRLEPGTDTSSKDIAVKTFTNSSDYFYELYDGANACREEHDPYVRGFDYSKLAASGVGVPAKVGGGKLTAENNMWAIAANITEQDSDIIPVLITRNVDVKALEYIINHGGPTSNLNTMITLGAGPYKTPFGDKGFVMVRKGGGTFSNTAKNATLKHYHPIRVKRG